MKAHNNIIAEKEVHGVYTLLTKVNVFLHDFVHFSQLKINQI